MRWTQRFLHYSKYIELCPYYSEQTHTQILVWKCQCITEKLITRHYGKIPCYLNGKIYRRTQRHIYLRGGGIFKFHPPHFNNHPNIHRVNKPLKCEIFSSVIFFTVMKLVILVNIATSLLLILPNQKCQFTTHNYFYSGIMEVPGPVNNFIGFVFSVLLHQYKTWQVKINNSCITITI